MVRIVYPCHKATMVSYWTACTVTPIDSNLNPIRPKGQTQQLYQLSIGLVHILLCYALLEAVPKMEHSVSSFSAFSKQQKNLFTRSVSEA